MSAIVPTSAVIHAWPRKRLLAAWQARLHPPVALIKCLSPCVDLHCSSPFIPQPRNPYWLLALAETTNPTRVPSIVGLSNSAAQTAIANASMVSGIISTAYSSTVAAGVVIAQAIPAGQVVSGGAALPYTLSLGPSPTLYPTILATIEALSAAGFVASPVFNYQYSATVPDGYVIALTPSPGSSVPYNTAVQLTVSMGPANPVNSTSIPNVVGQGVIQAQQNVTAASCTVAAVNYQTSQTIKPMIIISQSPGPGGPVPLWTQVTLIASSGPLIVYPGTGNLTVPGLP